MQQNYCLKDGRSAREGFRAFRTRVVICGLLARCASLLLGLILVALQGCALPIPTPEHGLLSGRGEINEAAVAFLGVAKTTREEVLLRLGEPSATLDDERTLIYRWSVVGAYVDGGNIFGIWPIPKHYQVLFEFDDRGRLKRFERSPAAWDEWTPPKGAGACAMGGCS